MIFDSFGNAVNNDGTPVNAPLSGSFINIGDSTNNFGGGSTSGAITLSGKMQMLDNSGNIVILFDPNG